MTSLSKGLRKKTDNMQFAYDCYRRLIQMFGNVVFGIDAYLFEQIIHKLKAFENIEQDRDVTAEMWKGLIVQYQQLIKEKARREFPQDVYEQLRLAVTAVFKSWNNQRAKVYRKIHHIPDEQGTAVNVQSMVFGNVSNDSGTGVLFTRNPSTGENELFGEYLINAQGEDVVSGVRTPSPISQLHTMMPDLYVRLVETAKKLEGHYKDMQDIEFTMEKGKLYILQTRSGKRTAQAAVKIAVDLVGENVISREEALKRIEVEHLHQLLHRAIQAEAEMDVIAEGLPASPGAASGQAVFDADTAEQWVKSGKKVILVRGETTPEDIHGVLAAEGLITSRGGMTSHAAVVARGMGKPCVCGCEKIRIHDRGFTSGDRIIGEGDWISIDGGTGKVISGPVLLKEPELSGELAELLSWADQVRSLKIYTNADNPLDAQKAKDFGAEGIGLCRTEHMFFSRERLPIVRKMILAENEEERRVALHRLLPMQRGDFEEMFRVMNGLPVTIRLLDPPLHEFLPNMEELLEKKMKMKLGWGMESQAGKQELERLDRLIRKVKALHESNPMLGQRGCRLGIVFPEIYIMQAQAIFQAVMTCRREGIEVIPEIMIPLVGHENELKKLRELVDQVASQELRDSQEDVSYKVGTMIEVPRAALTAAKISEYADFFSFGTNDLTQMTFGYSRDDAEGKFLTHYIEHGLLPLNPFQTLDREGVGRLVEFGVQQGRLRKPDLKTGICGEHGGDKDSIFFCHSVGLNYVSCSPYRVPLARIAAAQAALMTG
jgi:pyruvate,orthophosphate dikinase